MTDAPTITQAPVLALTWRGQNLFQLTILAPPGDWGDPGRLAKLRAWGQPPAGQPLLDRPFSVHRYRPGARELDFLIRVVGPGTQALAQLRPGQTLQITGPLGQGLRRLQPDFPQTPLYLVAGGVGLAPQANLLDQLQAPAHLFYGERRGQALIDHDYLAGLAPNFTAISEDGLGYGQKGQVTEPLLAALNQERRAIFACGPPGLLTALAPVARTYKVPYWASVEAFLACGLGVCLSCSRALTDGSRIRLCQDGPVVDGLTLDWGKP
ncbi:MAG: hypothetical protein LBR11_12955 [Deltaproteobacteria bacterium]|jgi:dihydroorotate dehydrogenase electron transfer subunit|nr:hypothetical protein [Deltaproteobacteria bacterium]